MAAKDGVPECQRHDGCQDQHDPDTRRDQHPLGVGIGFLQRRNGVGHLAVGPDGGFARNGAADALEGGHGAQCHDEGDQPQQADQATVDEPTKTSGENSATDGKCRERECGEHRRCVSPIGHSVESLAVDPRDDRCCQGDGGAGGEIDPPGDDDQGHAQGRDADQGRVVEHHLNALRGEKLGFASLIGRHLVFDRAKDQRDDHQAQQRSQ